MFKGNNLDVYAAYQVHFVDEFVLVVHDLGASRLLLLQKLLTKGGHYNNSDKNNEQVRYQGTYVMKVMRNRRPFYLVPLGLNLKILQTHNSSLNNYVATFNSQVIIEVWIELQFPQLIIT